MGSFLRGSERAAGSERPALSGQCALCRPVGEDYHFLCAESITSADDWDNLFLLPPLITPLFFLSFLSPSPVSHFPSLSFALSLSLSSSLSAFTWWKMLWHNVSVSWQIEHKPSPVSSPWHKDIHKHEIQALTTHTPHTPLSFTHAHTRTDTQFPSPLSPSQSTTTIGCWL